MNTLKKINVYYVGWGEDWHLGTLMREGRETVFEYTEAALEHGIEFSPANLPLQKGAFTSFEAHQAYLPGFIHDSLPDGWGLRLIDRVLRAQGISHPDVFDRLRYLGDNAMGALRFEPAEEAQHPWPNWTLKDYAEEIRHFQKDAPEEVLRTLAQTGGSPHGARPKVLLTYDPKSLRVWPQEHDEGKAWMFKFPADNDPPDVCLLEHIYAECARAAGMEMMPTVYLSLDSGLSAFGVQRFDRQDDYRVPMVSMAGLLHCDFRLPGAVSYRELLLATQLLTQDKQEVLRAFRRMVFNVVFHNRDDHPKNFAWTLSKNRRWRLSPAYDLTFSHGPGGEHHLDIAGKGTQLHGSDLLRFAQRVDISASEARTILDEVKEATSTLYKLLHNEALRPETICTVQATVKENVELLKR